VDARSWHGGAAIALDEDCFGYRLDKWTLQAFREIPLEESTNIDSLERFTTRHSVLQPSCGGGVCFDVVSPKNPLDIGQM